MVIINVSEKLKTASGRTAASEFCHRMAHTRSAHDVSVKLIPFTAMLARAVFYNAISCGDVRLALNKLKTVITEWIAEIDTET